MTSPITVHNAAIRTATVTVRALTIGGKQVTQAVFRQLPEEPWEIARHAGPHSWWGHVRYCPKDCTYRDHRHVIWQDDDVLFRSLIVAPSWDSVDEAYAQFWAQVKLLPQLFIAV